MGNIACRRHNGEYRLMIFNKLIGYTKANVL
jgi:hypothetical protein